MPVLEWDKVGERIYQAGLDRGILFLNNAPAVVWNGLINVEESSDIEVKPFYLDGVKYLEIMYPGDFVGKLTAFTYPEEFNSVNGIADVAIGLSYHDQPPKSFNLCYRTKIGNDLEGVEHGYKIHILYNVIATPDAIGFNTLTNSESELVEFGWTLTGTPPKMDRFRPTIHVSIDSRTTEPFILQVLEDKLYGTATTAPSLPTVQDISEIFGYLGALIIIDHGDGSWTAIDEADTYITMTDPTTFQIDNVDTVVIDANTYEISSTNVA